MRGIERAFTAIALSGGLLLGAKGFKDAADELTKVRLHPEAHYVQTRAGNIGTPEPLSTNGMLAATEIGAGACVMLVTVALQ